MLSPKERSVFAIFRQYLATPGHMICLDAATVQKYKVALRGLVERRFLLKERFEGGYSLTQAGFTAMTACDEEG